MLYSGWRVHFITLKAGVGMLIMGVLIIVCVYVCARDACNAMHACVFMPGPKVDEEVGLSNSMGLDTVDPKQESCMNTSQASIQQISEGDIPVFGSFSPSFVYDWLAQHCSRFELVTHVRVSCTFTVQICC